MKFYELVKDKCIKFMKQSAKGDITYKSIVKFKGELMAITEPKGETIDYFIKQGFSEITEKEYNAHLHLWKDILKATKRINQNEYKYLESYARKTKSNSTH